MTTHIAAEEWLTPGQAAARLGISVDTLRRWETAGTFTPIRTPGGQRRYRASEITAYLNAQTA